MSCLRFVLLACSSTPLNRAAHSVHCTASPRFILANKFIETPTYIGGNFKNFLVRSRIMAGFKGGMGGMGNMQNMLREAQKMQEQMQKADAELED